MNYELAKQLQNAGFPKELFFTCTGCYFQTHAPENYHVVNEPTILELLEACGDDFGGLAKRPDGFMAWKFQDPEVNHVEASTPEEAVAKLWLALNEKLSPDSQE